MSAHSPDNFVFEKDGPVSTITFNRPERRNCMNREVMAEFERLIHRVRDDRETRALIVTGQRRSLLGRRRCLSRH